MGKLTLKKAHLSEVNLLLEGDQKSEISWNNLKQVNVNAYRLKPSEDYDYEHLILGFIEEPDCIFLHVKISQFINETDSVKSDIEKIEHLDSLIKKQLGISIRESLLYSFSVVPILTLQIFWSLCGLTKNLS